MRLADTGLVSVERIGNQKYYQANRASPVFDDLHGLVVKTSGLLGPLRTALLPLTDRIRAAFVYGSIAKGTDGSSSDIDLMVIGEDLEYADLFSTLQPVERELARPINPNVMSLEQWRRKQNEKGFVARMSREPRLYVVGSDSDLV